MATTELTFRPAVPADAEVLSALVQSAYRGEESRRGWTTEADLLDNQRIGAAEIVATIGDPDAVVLTVRDEQDDIIGCCELRRRGAGRAYFGLFAIRPALQAAGIGRAVLAEAETYARRTWGSTVMEMQVIGQRDDLIAWYARRGYTRTDDVRAFPYEVVGPGQATRDDLYFAVLTKALSAADSPAPPAGGYVGDPEVQARWDGRYADREQLWSGQPNGALVAEVAGLTPGRVLDVGCGEGADAVWLARGGWDVTALEVSGVALERAVGHARDAGVAVRWVHAQLEQANLAAASFDLVSAQYPALLRTPDAAAERALLAAVAPGGLLLLVHHAGMDTQPVHDSDFDPADYVWPAMVAALLDDAWQVETNEQRPRIAPDGGDGSHHADDLVLRARRLR